MYLPKKLEDMTMRAQIVVAIYWTVTTLTTVGYGDIFPRNNMEYVFTITVEFLGILFFAAVMGSIN